MNIENIPKELKDRHQWVLWKLENVQGRKKPAKVPYSVNGQRASSTNPADWTSFEKVLEVYQKNEGVYRGLGYVFSIDDPYTGIDLDDCIRDGKLTEEAREILIQLNSYTERSQSMKGVHTIVKAKMPGERNRTGKYEMYDHSRFFVVTGDHVKHTPETIEERQVEINSLYDQLFHKPKKVTPVATDSTDQDVLAIALRARNGEKFGKLYSGDWSEYESQSEADQALCNMVAFFTKDPDQIDRLFRGSGLMRDKWEREDYRDRTISKALDSVAEQYQGKKNTATAANNVTNSLPQENENNEQEFDFLLDVPAEWDERIDNDALYGLAGDVVRLIEPHTEADPSALLINFLTIFGNVIGTNPHFIVSGGQHRMKLFSVLVGATFRGKKGTSLEPVMKLMTAVDPSLIRRKASGLSSGEGVIFAVRDPRYEKVAKYEGQGKDKRKTGEYEEVMTDEGVEDKRLLIVETEFGGVLNVLRREGNTLSAIIRNAWDGSGDIRTLTKNPMTATDTHISIMGHITPEELRKLITGTEIYNGFVNRFLWLYVTQSKSLPSGGEFHKQDVSQIVERIKDAVRFAEQVSQPMERDETAHRLWNRVYEPLQRDDSGIIGAATSRVIPYVMRLACIYALLDKTHIVSEKHLRAALALWKYCYKSVKFIFGEQNIQYDPTVNRILDALKTSQRA